MHPATSPIRGGGGSRIFVQEYGHDATLVTVSDSDSDRGSAAPPVVLPPLAGVAARPMTAHPGLAAHPLLPSSTGTGSERRPLSKRQSSRRRVARNDSFASTMAASSPWVELHRTASPGSLTSTTPAAVLSATLGSSTASAAALRAGGATTTVPRRRSRRRGLGKAVLARTATATDLRAADALARKGSVVQSRLTAAASADTVALAEMQRRVRSWDASRRRLVREQDAVAKEQRRAAHSYRHMQRAAMAAMSQSKAPLRTIDPRRVTGSRLMDAVRPAAAEWRRGSLLSGWQSWRRFTTHTRAEADALAAKATQLQAVYRGFRARQQVAAAGSRRDPALVITRFFRRVVQVRTEERARDVEASAVAIQRALRASRDGKSSRRDLRRRVTAALAVLGRGSTSRVLRGVGWGSYPPPAAGGFGIFRDSWAAVGAAQAGVSAVKPQEEALPPECRDRIRQYLGGTASTGDCFVVARALCVLEDGGKGGGSYTMMELAKAAKQLEAVVDAVLRVRGAERAHRAVKRGLRK